MINLIAHLPNPEDATSYWRGAWPLKYLKKKIPDLNLIINPELNYHSLVDCDLIFMQRPCTQGHVMIANMANEMGIPVWIDYDDDLFVVPRDNPNYSAYSDPMVKANMTALVMFANIVSTSTEPLKRSILGKTKNTNVIVIPNAFDDYGPLLKRRLDTESKKGCISWRGGATHQRDLNEFKQDIWNVDKSIPDLHWHFYGYYPWSICEDYKLKMATHHGMSTTLNYFNALQKIRPQVHIVPLHDSVFNRSKSNIAWIEASYAGAVTLAPLWDTWSISKNMVDYNDEVSFEDALSLLLREADCAKMAKDSWQEIMDTLRLSKINELREDIVRKLTHK